MSFNICPARFVGGDVVEMVDRFKTAGERLTFLEQESLPAPYLDACMYAGRQLEAVRWQPARKKTST